MEVGRGRRLCPHHVSMTNQPLAYTPYDVADAPPRALGNVYLALESGMLTGKQNGNQRCAK